MKIDAQETLSLESGLLSVGQLPWAMHGAQKVWPQLMDITGSVNIFRHSEHTSDAEGFAKKSCGSPIVNTAYDKLAN